SARLPAAPNAGLPSPSTANKTNIVAQSAPSGAFFKARTGRQCRDIERHPVAIQTPAHGRAVCRTTQMSDEDFGGRSGRIGSTLGSVRSGVAVNGATTSVKAASGIVKGTTPAKW